MFPENAHVVGKYVFIVLYLGHARMEDGVILWRNRSRLML